MEISFLKHKHYYSFIDISEISNSTKRVPVYEFPFILTTHMMDTVEDCFNGYITLKHVANVRINYIGAPSNLIFSFIDKSITLEHLNLKTLNIVIKNNGKIAIPNYI